MLHYVVRVNVVQVGEVFRPPLGLFFQLLQVLHDIWARRSVPCPLYVFYCLLFPVHNCPPVALKAVLWSFNLDVEESLRLLREVVRDLQLIQHLTDVQGPDWTGKIMEIKNRTGF